MGSFQSETSSAYVICCSDYSVDGYPCKTIGNCENESEKVSYAKAKFECSKDGMRLCTKDELLSDVCCKTAGKCDSVAVWTSTAG